MAGWLAGEPVPRVAEARAAPRLRAVPRCRVLQTLQRQKEVVLLLLLKGGQLAGFWCQQGDSCVNRELLMWRFEWYLF